MCRQRGVTRVGVLPGAVTQAKEGRVLRALRWHGCSAGPCHRLLKGVGV